MAQPNPEATKLNIGCGPDCRSTLDGWDNIDRWEYEEWVVPVDLELGKLPYADNSIEYIYASHVLEHVFNYPALMNEFWRVMKPKGELYIEVPHFPHDNAVKDPTHVRFFNMETFLYFSTYQEDGLFKMYQFKPWHLPEHGISSDAGTIRCHLIAVK